jgi:hypothetical protein
LYWTPIDPLAERIVNTGTQRRWNTAPTGERPKMKAFLARNLDCVASLDSVLAGTRIG